MRVQNLAYMRLAAIILSCAVASLTICNLLTVVTHGIEFDIPDENDFSWAVDPAGQTLLITTEFSVHNHGAYDIDGIDIAATIDDENGGTLLQFSDRDLAVSRGTDKTFEVLIPIRLEELDVGKWFPLVYTDTVLTLNLDIDVDYMFGLVHVTVDERIRRPWTAPFSSSDLGTGIFDGLSSLFGIMNDEYECDIDEVQRMLIQTVASVKSFDISTGDGHRFWFNNTEGTGNMNVLSCDLTVPIGHNGCVLKAGFSLDVGIEEDRAVVVLREVMVHYVG